jgi:hypothetical protein
MMKDKIEIIANLTIAVFDAVTGKLLDVIKKHNLYVTLGKTLIANLLNCTADVTGLNYFAVGTGDTAAALTDTKLEAEEFRDTFTKTTVTTGNLNVQYYLASGDANGNTLTEAGLFGDDATGVADSGTLAARAVHTGIAKTASVAITYSWDITIS